MSGRRLILLMSVSMDGVCRLPRPDDRLAGPPSTGDEQATALRNVVKAPPQLVFRLYTEAEHLSAGGSTPPRDVIDKLDLRVGRRYRYKVHSSIAARFESGGAPGLRASGRARGIAAERSIHREQAVLLWSVLENAGAPVTVQGFGMLFDDRQPDVNKTEER